MKFTQPLFYGRNASSIGHRIHWPMTLGLCISPFFFPCKSFPSPGKLEEKILLDYWNKTTVFVLSFSLSYYSLFKFHTLECIPKDDLLILLQISLVDTWTSTNSKMVNHTLSNIFLKFSTKKKQFCAFFIQIQF